jgi:predicted GH43/DUF377 family glycosyl hydrolase
MYKNKIILSKSESSKYNNFAVLNPSAIIENNHIYLYYRSVNKQKVSSISLCLLKNDEIINCRLKPVILPEYEYEYKGVEDPRIVKIDSIFYLTYTAYDGINARIAVATSKNGIDFKKEGVISPQIKYKKVIDLFLKNKKLELKDKYLKYGQIYIKNRGENMFLWDKDGILFPKKINGKFVLLHRIYPSIQMIEFDSFEELKQDDFWETKIKNIHNDIVLNPKYWFENSYIGGGCPPIEIPEGWLFVYHTVESNNEGNIYHASIALLNKNNPRIEISRMKNPLFSPDSDWEKNGWVNNVVFPSGAYIVDDKLYIYYGAADQYVALKVFEMKTIRESLNI